MWEPRLAWGLVLAALAAPPATKSKWTTSGSGLDTTLTLEVQGAARLALLPPRPKLILKCEDRKLILGVLVGLLNEDVATVRFDSEAAFEAGLHNRVKFGKLRLTSTVIDPGTMFFDKPEPIVASLLRHRRMLVRVTPSTGPTEEVIFELPTLEPHLPAFEKACNLKEPIERPTVAAAVPPNRPTSPTHPAGPGAPALRKFGSWRQSVTTSRIDDLPVVLLSLAQAKGSSGPPTSLVLRCREKQAEAFLNFEVPLFLAPHGKWLLVRASADGGAQDKEWWLVPSTDNRAYFFSSTPQLLKRLLASQELRLVYGPRKHPEEYPWMPKGEAVFSPAGLDRASEAFLAACPIDLAKVKVRDGLAKLP